MLLSPDKSWYLSELASRLGTSPSSLQREFSNRERHLGAQTRRAPNLLPGTQRFSRL